MPWLPSGSLTRADGSSAQPARAWRPLTGDHARRLASDKGLYVAYALGDFIARDAPSVAQVFAERVFEAVKRLEAFPRSGRVVPEIGQENIREIIFGSYRIVYVVSEEEINLLTVFHAARLLRPTDLPGGASE